MPKKKAAKREFAPTLFVKLEEHDNDNPAEGFYHLAGTDESDWNTLQAGTRVGIYKLQQVNVVQQAPSLVAEAKPKRARK